MTELIREVFKDEIEEERNESERKGKLSQALETCVNAIKKGLGLEIIKDIVNLPEKDFNKIYPQALKLAV